jgi:23S rRNA pseudouridine2605 synthase
MQERLQKLIARAGLASRREAERLIAEGRVTVNGKVAHLGDKADPAQDHVKVKGRLLPRAERLASFLFYKPRGVLTQAGEAPDHPTVSVFFQDLPYRLFPVGRLDLDSEGLLVVTNDGDLAHALMHPASGVPKRYRVKTKGVPGARALDLLRKGVPLEDGRTAPAEVRLIETTRTNAWLEVVLHEGRYRQVRRMFDRVGHSVLKLKRTAYAFLKPGALKPGTYRRLTDAEVVRLKALAAGGPKAPGGADTAPGKPPASRRPRAAPRRGRGTGRPTSQARTPR